eukprot:m.401460 g.401460  ORF g.401460 m.401460 type:complete len:803 (-) comp21166_c0_seq3:55-2463(-)
MDSDSMPVVPAPVATEIFRTAIGHKPAVTFRNKICTCGTKTAIICSARVVVLLDYTEFAPDAVDSSNKGDANSVSSRDLYFSEQPEGVAWNPEGTVLGIILGHRLLLYAGQTIQTLSCVAQQNLAYSAYDISLGYAPRYDDKGHGTPAAADSDTGSRAHTHRRLPTVAAAVASPMGIEVFLFTVPPSRMAFDRQGDDTLAHLPDPPHCAPSAVPNIVNESVPVRAAYGADDCTFVAALSGTNMCAIAIAPRSEAADNGNTHEAFLAAAARTGLVYIVTYCPSTRTYKPMAINGHPGGFLQLVSTTDKELRVTEIQFRDHACLAVCTAHGQVFVIDRVSCPSTGTAVWHVSRCVFPTSAVSAPGAWLRWLPAANCAPVGSGTSRETRHIVVLRCLAGRRTQLAVCAYTATNAPVALGQHGAPDKRAPLHEVGVVEFADELRGLGVLADGTCVAVSNVGQLCLYAPIGTRTYGRLGPGRALPPRSTEAPADEQLRRLFTTCDSAVALVHGASHDTHAVTLQWDVQPSDASPQSPTGETSVPSRLVPVPFLSVEDVSPDPAATSRMPAALVCCSKQTLAVYSGGMVYAMHWTTDATWRAWALPVDHSELSDHPGTGGIVCFGVRGTAVGVCTTDGRVVVWCGHKGKLLCSTQAFTRPTAPYKRGAAGCPVLALPCPDSTDSFVFVQRCLGYGATHLFTCTRDGGTSTITTHIQWHDAIATHITCIGSTEEYVILHEHRARASPPLGGPTAGDADGAVGWLWACHRASALTTSWQIPTHHVQHLQIRLADVLHGNAAMRQIFSTLH